MSGRRLRNTVREVLEQNGAADNNTHIIIAGLSNAYSHYITTFEEYSIQRYEGASTLYGPNTLAGYQQEYSKLAAALATGTPYPPGPTPPDLSGDTFSFMPPVIVDEPPLFGHFGQVATDADASYGVGDTVEVVFWGANPRNDFRTQESFLTVEQFDGDNWNVMLTDGDFETKFKWQRYGIAASLVTVEWEIPPWTPVGTYRVQTFWKIQRFSWKLLSIQWNL